MDPMTLVNLVTPERKANGVERIVQEIEKLPLTW